MKKLILTGLATEQSFIGGGQASYFLVFNDGELRVPVSEKAAEVVVQEMYGESNEPASEQESDGYEEMGDSGISQPEIPWNGAPQDSDDGVNQV